MRLMMIMLSFTLFSSTTMAKISGVYMAADTESAEFIHLVEGQDGALIGQLEYVTISDNHKVETASRNLTGTVRNNAIALNLEIPIVDWFTSTTLTGTVSRGVLKLSYSGDTAVYKKATDRQRETALKQIETTALKHQQAEIAERAQKNLVILTENVEALTKRTESDVKWFAEHKEAYSKLFAEGRVLEERIEKDRRRRADPDIIYVSQDALYDVNDKVWSLDRIVTDRVSAIRAIRINIENASKKLKEVCPADGSNSASEFCIRVKVLEADFDGAIAESRKAFDALAAYRETVKI